VSEGGHDGAGLEWNASLLELLGSTALDSGFTQLR
jgi:hypothetical protein